MKNGHTITNRFFLFISRFGVFALFAIVYFTFWMKKKNAINEEREMDANAHPQRSLSLSDIYTLGVLRFGGMSSY